MMKRIYLISAIIVLIISTIKAQDIKILQIGDMLPDLAIGKTVPVTNANATTSDYKDKLLILDLWATNCSSCIDIMPEFDKLQKQFGTAIKILPVTREPEEQILNFWKKNRHTRDLSISTVVEGVIFSKYFPHRFISHDVWVYKGKVIAITAPEYVTAENIQKILDGQQVNLPLKYDFGPGFDGSTQRLQDSAIVTSLNLSKYATISDFRKDVSIGTIVNYDRGGIVKDSVKRSVRSYFINQSIYNAYLWSLMYAQGKDYLTVLKAILGGNQHFAPTRVIWEVADKSKYNYQKGDQTWNDWMSKNAVCFESLYPDTGQTAAEAFTQVAKDLNDLLGLDVRFEKRKMKVLILTNISQTDLLKTKNTGIDPSFNEVLEGSSYQLRNNKLSAFIDEFNQYDKNPYAIDETSYKEKVDLDLNIPDWTNIPSIRKELAKYGLGLKEEIREIEVLVFTETGGGYKQASK